MQSTISEKFLTNIYKTHLLLIFGETYLLFQSSESLRIGIGAGPSIAEHLGCKVSLGISDGKAFALVEMKGDLGESELVFVGEEGIANFK